MFDSSFALLRKLGLVDEPPPIPPNGFEDDPRPNGFVLATGSGWVGSWLENRLDCDVSKLNFAVGLLGSPCATGFLYKSVIHTKPYITASIRPPKSSCDNFFLSLSAFLVLGALDLDWSIMLRLFLFLRLCFL